MDLVRDTCLQNVHRLLMRMCPVDGVLTNAQDLGIKVATPVGTLIGQLLFGWLGDVFGRKRMCEPLRS